MEVSELIQQIELRDDYAGQIVHIETLPEQVGTFQTPEQPLPDPVAQLLDCQGITQLYSHQVEMLTAARANRDSVVVTGTASGKTLSYNLPIFERILEEPNARTLYLYPTKALAQDQLKGLLALIERAEQVAPDCAGLLRPGVYDGDTPTAQRRRIRNEANLILSNPDMLHAGILPYHAKWSSTFSDLRFVVVDEIHMYRGILGAHVAAVLRRLQRICRHYGSNPVFLSASATIANPGELASRLLGRSVEVIDNDGAPRGRKRFVLWNPELLGSDHLARSSANDDAVSWLVEAMQAGGQALAFTRTRQAAELIHRYVREELIRKHSPLAEKVRAYRGGYLPNERREIEQQLFSGELRAIASTNALELGIDIGSLDVAVLVNYPGTIASCWQQAGRSGRRADESVAVLLAGNDPVDQYLIRHPEYFFSQTPENAVVDPDNPYVLAKHLPAAAFELPLTEPDFDQFGKLASPIAEALSFEGELTKIGEEYYFSGGQNPAVSVSLRHMSDNTFSIVQATAEGKHVVVANVDSISAPELVYPEAVYLHDGETYLVRELDLQGKVAYIEREETDYYTQAVLESKVDITNPRAERELYGRSQSDDGALGHNTALGGYGEVDVSWKTVAFKKIKFATRENIGLGPVDIPEQHLETTACWLTPSEVVRTHMKQAGHKPSEGLVGFRNVAVVVLPMIAMCDSRDIGGVVDSMNLGKSTLILYDRYPGGLGYCEKGYQHLPQLIVMCRELVVDCPCEEGCPSCVGLPNLRPAIHSDPDLTRGHPIPNKQATLCLLDLLSDGSHSHDERASQKAIGSAESSPSDGSAELGVGSH